jgi:hypothetical protein
MGGLCGTENKKVKINSSKEQFKFLIVDSRSTEQINRININTNNRGGLGKILSKIYLLKNLKT